MRGRAFAGAVGIALVAAALLAAAPPAHGAAKAGSLDSSFGKAGIVLTQFGLNAGGAQIEAVPSDALVLANGDILVSGNFGLIRYLPSGTPDSSFGSGGMVTLSFTPGGTGSLAQQPNGDIIVVGTYDVPDPTSVATEFAVERLLPNGSPDDSFGTGGLVVTDAGGAGADAVALQPGNPAKIVVGGTVTLVSYRSETQETALARYTANGSLDPTFGNAGVVVSGPGGVQSLAIDSGDNVLVLPSETEFSATGALQPTVAPVLPIVASSSGGPDLFLGTGQTLQGQTVSIAKRVTDAHVQRYTAGGAVDPSYVSPNITFQNGSRTSLNAITAEPNGDTVLGGADFLGTSSFGLARVTSTGALDTTFGNGGTVTTTIQGDEGVAVVVFQPAQDRIVAIGPSEDNSTGLTDLALAGYVG